MHGHRLKVDVVRIELHCPNLFTYACGRVSNTAPHIYTHEYIWLVSRDC
jgi:hypothetical protein